MTLKVYDKRNTKLNKTPKKVPWLDLLPRQVNTLCTLSLNRKLKYTCHHLRGSITWWSAYVVLMRAAAQLERTPQGEADASR